MIYAQIVSFNITLQLTLLYSEPSEAETCRRAIVHGKGLQLNKTCLFLSY